MSKWRKLSPEAKRLISTQELEEGSRVTVLLRCHEALAASQRERLKELEVEVRSQAGDVVTAMVETARLPDLADLDFVLYIDVSRPLFPE